MKIETVSYLINWKRFKPGTSFFVPCIDTAAARESVAQTTRRLRIKTINKVVIEDGVKGLRVWRV
jgi:hypothetical protein